MKGLIMGMGRMGLTHLALANALSSEKIYWYLYEPNFKNRVLMKNIDKYVSTMWVDDVWISQLSEPLDIAFVCSPPPKHEANIIALSGKVRNLFVEKPISVLDSSLFESFDKVMIGYVLRHNKMASLAKNFVEVNDLVSLELELSSNTILSQNSGWRGCVSKGGGVVNEFGSHLINLMMYLIGEQVKLVKVEKESVFSLEAEDRARLWFEANDINIKLDLNWSDSTVRKPLYTASGIAGNGNKFYTDMFEFGYSDSGVEYNENIASIGEAVDFYLRGFEFSHQTANFLYGEFDQIALIQAVKTDEIIQEVHTWK